MSQVKLVNVIVYDTTEKPWKVIAEGEVDAAIIEGLSHYIVVGQGGPRTYLRTSITTN